MKSESNDYGPVIETQAVTKTEDETKPKRKSFTIEEREKYVELARDLSTTEKEKFCKKLDIHTSTLYQWIREREKQEDYLKEAIAEKLSHYEKELELRNKEIDSLKAEIITIKGMMEYQVDYFVKKEVTKRMKKDD